MAATLPRPVEAEHGRLAHQTEPPPLNNGDRLSRAEFERRYAARPDIRKAELIEGSVYVPSPVRFFDHGAPHTILAWWAQSYAAGMTAVWAAVDATVRLDNDNVVQPDVLLRIEPLSGGGSVVTADGFLDGPPELIVEVAASSAAYDMHQKRHVYQRSGVREYVAAQVYEKALAWFVLREGVYEPLAADDRGILRSEVFPGLWLKPDALWQRDLAGMLAVLQEGLATPERHAFAARLAGSTTVGEAP